MRFAHARPATVTLVAGSVLITATSGLSLAAVMGETPAWAHPSGYAVALDDAAATTGNQSCEPVKLTTRRPPGPDGDPDAHGDGYDSGRVHDAHGDPDGNEDRLVDHADFPAAGPLDHAVRPTVLDPSDPPTPSDTPTSTASASASTSVSARNHGRP